MKAPFLPVLVFAAASNSVLAVGACSGEGEGPTAPAGLDGGLAGDAAVGGDAGGQGGGGGWPWPDDPEVVEALAWSEAAFAEPGHEPFSFFLGGTASSALLPGWRVGHDWQRLDELRALRTVEYRDPDSGLEIRVEVTERFDFPSLEWVVHLTHTGDADSPILEAILPLDADLGPAVPSGVCEVHHAAGSRGAIDDFAPRQTALGPGDSLALRPFEGRSSDGVLPFFNVAFPSGSGIVAGVGWSGQWAASLARGSTGALRAQAGMEQTHLRLRPGESIRTPSILLLFWHGADSYRGQVFLRRLLRRHYTPEAAR
ncbi:MAG: hypothetical protein JRI23_28035, partial [Deltaproteobacteria bacterium]|nr:hypothetical protein [Deltaproteobacteria bacterium]MBW2535942.1 hypothetical protein [Deltaproteobacteria bacterium]